MIEYLTIEQAAERAQVSRATVKRWMKEGMPFLILGPKLKRIRVGVFDAWLAHKFEGTLSSQDVLALALSEIQVIEKIGKSQL